jgi:hydrogenase nickel incorporation protein HypA/HybF
VHELSLCEAIAGSVSRHADGRPVARVNVRIGHLRQVVPDTLTFCWGVLVDGTDLAGSALEVEQVPATLRCNECGTVTTLDLPILMCEACQTTDVTLLTGEELTIMSLDLAEA